MSKREIRKALALIRGAIRSKYGRSGRPTESGELTVFISPSIIEFTDIEGTVIAQDLDAIAQILTRARR